MNYSIGIIAALATLLCWTVGTFAFTAASKNAEPLIVNRVRLLFAATALTMIVVLIVPAQQWIAGIEQWLWMGASGIIGLTIGDYFAFNAYRMIGGSKASLFATFAPAAALLLGMVLLHENINATGLFGMALSLVGITWFVWINGRKNKITAAQEGRGMLYAMLGAICQGVGLVLAKKGMNLHEINAIQATWMRMVMAAGSTYLIGAFRTNLWMELKNIFANTRALKPMLLGTLFGPVAGVSFSLLAAQNLEVSIAQTIFSMLPLSVISVAVITGRERVMWYAWIAAAVSIVGVVVLVWRDNLADWILG
jgi:drug/metabolite transporter (DMT)-like permease